MEQQVEATWRINSVADLTAAYVHFEPGAFRRAAHARPQDSGMMELAIHL